MRSGEILNCIEEQVNILSFFKVVNRLRKIYLP